ncbi:bifunctional 4-hydroxy-2-oxoglutarate aldolase/2-dehydro-3-deoxy-phosphogluconate aldolase [Vibrio sp. DW001]|uniref:bifunctional 4-hydroxy-2-oxoglutarate aldolase/2-dehydro-3-deoxy-phosphogluconate aldolase n=1 Tax=Vibrio sp. DW001 TaxID=2912315 RepID=UPI0023AFF116|nr:bifunctional 4-hydroxy-2-oxoglutarate aldolase/2-dehydro-3-deoxy-phosphogluconate aldolase [Vibrio sp. DW001]WED26757.1 bifunctional 4-hydroxy-2-oxoglutarate aldolase/2-dehydro-3-deoxy-phosphogluconate aldolase [Vibrio sp. DW001]
MTQLINELSALKLVPVIVIDSAEDILPIGKLLVDNGLPIAEITYRSSAAGEAIRLLKDNFPGILIGAGTVLNKEQVMSAKESGADFIVSPGVNVETIATCREENITIVPGVNSPSDIELALNNNISLVKYFPAEASGGVTMLKALLGPYNMLKVMPTGGITADNIQSYLDIDAVVACGGSWIVDRKLIQDKDWGKLDQLIKDACGQLNECE